MVLRFGGGAMQPLVMLCGVALLHVAQTKILNPPYFNIATGKQVTATATCGGEGYEPEEFCLLTGANTAEQEKQRIGKGNWKIIYGQLCNYCDETSHQPGYVVDGTSRRWQSPPLSRESGFNGNEVNLTIDLGQEYNVAYVYIRMGNSPRPGVWALDHSVDYGRTFQPWQYFADSPATCRDYFGVDKHDEVPTTDDEILCITDYSKVVPLEDGEIPIPLVQDRPGSGNFTESPTLQEFTKATHVRLRLLRTQTLQGDLMAVARQDATVTRRYFYSIRDISIGGRCVCNGHAESCNKPSPTGSLLCDCQHNTCGAQCDVCCEGFVQKPWRKPTNTDVNACEPCQCFGHAADCVYNATVDALGLSMDIQGEYEGGGVCQGCRDNTEGINCETCVAGYYRPSFKNQEDVDACQKCDCDTDYTTGDCRDGDGQCECKEQYDGPLCDRCAHGYMEYPECRPCDCFLNGTSTSAQCTFSFFFGTCECKPNFSGIKCDECAPTFYSFPQCTDCDCMMPGSVSQVCNVDTGACPCRFNFGGHVCERCQHGFYQYPDCNNCDCDAAGTVEEICDKTDGSCMCRPNFTGPRCDRCAPGFFNYPACTACECDSVGSYGDECSDQGYCSCRPGFGGHKCNTCSVGYYRYPSCLACGCASGALGISCDSVNGQCVCDNKFTGRMCDRCAANLYNYPVCEACNCNPAGAMEKPGYPLGGCGSFNNGMLCECKANVQGHTCDDCVPGTWGLTKTNPSGCQDCQCHRPGTLAATEVCDSSSGQCMCKTFVERRRCDVCSDGFFGLEGDSLYGCQDCGCDVGGSTNDPCDKVTGECSCLPRVGGPKCTQPESATYYPGFYQLRYEVEDGRTPLGGPVRYGYDETLFPGYSWRGYATLSRIQPDVMVDMVVTNPSVYRLIINYVNRNPEDVIATVVLTPVNSGGERQTATVKFSSTPDGPKKLMTDSSFVMDFGNWSISVQTPENILVESETMMVDFVALLPREYYEATLLQKRVQKPCSFADETLPCLVYTYVDASALPSASAGESYVLESGSQSPLTFTDYDGTRKMWPPSVRVDSSQPVTFNPAAAPPGRYVVMVEYTAPMPYTAGPLDVSVRRGGGSVTPVEWAGRAIVYGCDYDEPCRSVMTDTIGLPTVVDLTDEGVRVTLSAADASALINVHTVTLVPYADWDIEMITPRLSHVRTYPASNGGQRPVGYAAVPDSVHIEVEWAPNRDRIASGDSLPPTLRPSNDSDDAASPATSPKPRVIAVSPTDLDLMVPADVTVPGQYVVVVHYYQPMTIGFDAQVVITVDQLNYYGTIRLDYCPSVVGCRAVAKFPSAGVGDETIELSSSEANIRLIPHEQSTYWADYILLVPATGYLKENIVGLEPADLSSQFIEECSGPDGNFDWSVTSDEFKDSCLSAVFSLTTAYNYGALECGCKIAGVKNTLACNTFQGQCDCKANVIGRDCSDCASGYYNYPECLKCNCPALCDDGGNCICPPRVVGENCTECAPETYAYDPNIGCNDCLCDAQGVLNGNLTCDVVSGECQCKPHVVGRQCNRCETGYWGFPNCQECQCDLSGSEEGVCSQETGECLCRANVEGPRCDTCRPGTFALDAAKPEGCTPCDCSGVTRSCTGSTFPLATISEYEGWEFTSPESVSILTEPDSVTVLYNNVSGSTPEYLVAPEEYLSGTTLAYGGVLSYTLDYAVPLDAVPVPGPSVKLVSDSEALTLISVDGAPVRARRAASDAKAVRMVESEFLYEDGGGEVTRRDFLRLLARLDAILIKANPYEGMSGSTLSAEITVAIMTTPERTTANAVFTMTDTQGLASMTSLKATDMPSDVTEAIPVPGPGVMTMPATMMTMPSTMMTTPATPRPNTEAGLSGLGGVDWDGVTGSSPAVEEGSGIILPIPEESGLPRNRREVSGGALPSAVVTEAPEAGSLELALDVEVCTCPPSYAGSSCERCADGYYRRYTPTRFICAPCECHDHADTCDPETGVCINCTGNTAGDTCNECLVGHYGHAPTGDCTICTCPLNSTANNFAITCSAAPGSCICQPGYGGPSCDRCSPGYFGEPMAPGSACNLCGCNGNTDPSDDDACNHVTGVCKCLNNTAGDHCDRCEEMHWGDPLVTKNCTACDCDATGTDSCEQTTGVCMCRPNVVGDRCDQCAADHYGFESSVGCTTCACAPASSSSQCNATTGQCACNEGTTGLHCNQCKPLHWDYNEFGCTPCNCKISGAVGCNVSTGECSCLQGVTGERCDQCSPRWVLVPSQGCEACDNCVHTLLDDTDRLQERLGKAAGSLGDLSISVAVQRRLQDLNDTANELRDAFDSQPGLDTTALTDADRELTDLEGQVADLLTLSRDVVRAVSLAAEKFEVLKRRTLEANTTTNEQINDILDILDQLQMILDRLRGDSNIINSDQLLMDAYDIVNAMVNRTETLEDISESAYNELDMAQELLGRVLELSSDVTDQEEEAAEARKLLEEYLARIEDLVEETVKVNETLEESESTLDGVDPRFEQLSMLVEKVLAQMDIAEMNNLSSYSLLQQAATLLAQIQADTDTIPDSYNNDHMSALQNFTNLLSLANERSNASLQLALEHTANLTKTAMDLEGLLKNPKEASEGALEASRVYSEISDKIRAAWDATRAAIDDATNAIGQSKDIHNDTVQVLENSEELLGLAQESENASVDLGARLGDIEDALTRLSDQLADLMATEAEIRAIIMAFPKDQEQVAREAERVAKEALDTAQDALDRAEPLRQQISDGIAQLESIQSVEIDVATKSAQRLVDKFSEDLNETVSITEELEGQREGLNTLQDDLSDEIDKLRNKIQEAYKLTEKIPHGMELYENTTLELVIPANVYEDFKIKSEMTLYFNTTDSDALLFYLGPTNEQIKTNPEFLALSLVGGKLQYVQALGGDAATMTTANTYNDNQWHRVNFGHDGAQGTLRVDTQGKPSEEVKASTSHTLLELDPRENMTRLLIGGASEGTVLPAPLKNEQYVGQVEELKYDKTKIIPLWNFVDSQNVYGALERGNVLQEEVEESVQFSRSERSYLSFDKGSLRVQNPNVTQLTVVFKTYEVDGLVAFYGNGNGGKGDFLMVHLINGKPAVTVQLGNGAFTLEGRQAVNDGQFWAFVVTRDRTTLLLTTKAGGVSGATMDEILGTQEGKSTGLNLDANPEVHLGGLPLDSSFRNEIREPSFDGCIKEFVLFDQRDLHRPLKAFGTQSGCSIVRSNLHFLESRDGYAAIMGTDQVDTQFKLSMRIRTTEPDGLLFYQSDQDETYLLSVALVRGLVTVIGKYKAQPITNLTSMAVPGLNLTDGALHHILVEKNSSNFLIRIDDGDDSASPFSDKKHRYKTGADFFLGGVNFIPDSKYVGTGLPFVGCMQDIVVNDVAVNFAQLQLDETLILQSAEVKDCPKAESTDESVVVRGQKGWSCALPVPASTEPGKVAGIYFGGRADSRVELTLTPGLKASDLSYNNHQTLMFRTMASDGLLWGVGSTNVSGSVDTAGLYMSQGQLVYAVDTGSGFTRVTTPTAYNDHEWHTVVFTRTTSGGSVELTLRVDSDEPVSATLEGTTTSLGINFPIYLGGPGDSMLLSKLGENAVAFDGCIEENSLAYQATDDTVHHYYEDAQKSLIQTSPCVANQERGVYFAGNGAMTLAPSFKVGSKFSLSIEVRPRTIDGVLLAARTEKLNDFLALAIFDGDVVLSADNGGGDTDAYFFSPRNVTMCDGAWHSIFAEKVGTTLTLTVDNNAPVVQSMTSGTSAADTDSDLLLGGLFSDKVLKGNALNIPDYTGCVRNVILNGKPVDLTTKPSTGDVRTSCPTN